MELLPFVLATFSLLAIPGPTNTLLATSGAGIGIPRSVHLLAAELLGYLTAVAALRFALGPLVTDVPMANVVLRAAITVYVLYLARLLWRYRARELHEGAPVTFGAVLLTTLLNPKAAILAFLLLPSQTGFALGGRDGASDRHGRSCVARFGRHARARVERLWPS
jgi:threonine/homoserine/homoserine lactone efflux protein